MQNRAGGKPQVIAAVKGDSERLGYFPGSRVDLARRLVTRTFDNGRHIPCELCIAHADSRQIHAECLGGCRLLLLLFRIDHRRRRTANVPSVPGQGKIDPILPSKFKDRFTVQKGVRQAHRRIASARLKQNPGRPRNQFGADLGNKLSQPQARVVLSAKTPKGAIRRIHAKNRIIAYKDGLVDHRKPHAARL